MTAKEYLQSQGMTSENTLLVAFIEGTIRNPDFAVLLEGYAEHRMNQPAIDFMAEDDPDRLS